ncbi:hypothetical protein RB2083_1477 [Rhodobacteraceae bacterium HTCC2083]|nr:hypothetical protein RB2083_1477 [Rhodobacteraceae bacterium HTCC2083]
MAKMKAYKPGAAGNKDRVAHVTCPAAMFDDFYAARGGR